MAREKSCIKTLGTKTQTSFDFIWFVKKKTANIFPVIPQAKGKSTCIHTLCIAFVFNYLSTISTYLPPEYQYLPSYSTNPTSQIPPSQLPIYAVYMPFQILKTSQLSSTNNPFTSSDQKYNYKTKYYFRNFLIDKFVFIVARSWQKAAQIASWSCRYKKKLKKSGNNYCFLPIFSIGIISKSISLFCMYLFHRIFNAISALKVTVRAE